MQSTSRDEYLRVTKVLGFFSPPEFVDYLTRVGKKEAKRAGTTAMRFGSQVDGIIRGDIPMPRDPAWEVVNCLKAWESWKNDYGTELEFGVRLYDDELGLSGEPDFAWCEGLEITDIKCATTVRPMYFMQLGAYWHLAGRRAEVLSVLRLDKQSGMYEYVRSEDVGLSPEDCWRAFEGALKMYTVYNHLQGGLKPKESVYERDGYEG